MDLDDGHLVQPCTEQTPPANQPAEWLCEPRAAGSNAPRQGQAIIVSKIVRILLASAIPYK
jgi:hypothetical protein